MYSHGIDGIMVAMVSEVLRLSAEERCTLARPACEFGLEQGPVVISVGAESTKVDVEFCQQESRLGPVP